MPDKPIEAVPGPRIFLVRHGRTQYNVKKGTSKDVVRGQMNLPLTPEGKRESEEDAQRLSKASIRELYTSPLVRAVYMAQQIGEPYGLKPRMVHDLLPWDMGDLTGTNARLAKPILRRYAEEEPKRKVPGGENFNAWRTRLIGFIRKLMTHTEDRGVTVCCATHSRCIKLIEGWMRAGAHGMDIDFDVMFRDDTEPGIIFDLQPDANGRWDYHRISKGFVSK